MEVMKPLGNKRWELIGRTVEKRVLYFIHEEKKNVRTPPNSIQQSSPSEADICSVVQNLPRLLWNPKTHFRVLERPQL
jgi:hypothetical protein